MVAHGERRQGAGNRALLAHVAGLQALLPQMLVAAAVLKGAPSLAEAVRMIVANGADDLLVYPFLMSDGYFVSSVLPARLAACQFRGNTAVLPPLGLDPLFPRFVLEQSLAAAERAGFEAAESHLLLVGHGSQRSQASVEATQALAESIASDRTFASVGTAYLEQSPFVGNELAAQTRSVVVAGLFSGEGKHGWHDVPAAIEETGAKAVYTGPIGAYPGVVDIFAAAVRRATG